MDAARVYIPLQSEGIVAVDRDTGERVWADPLRTSWPVMVGDGVVFAVSNTAVHALDGATGAHRWERALERRLLTGPAFVDGRIILVLEQGDYVSLSAADGNEQWRLRIPNDAPLHPPHPGGDGRLFVALDNADVAAIAIDDGRLVWRRRLAGMLSTPTWAPDRVFVGSTDNFLYALDADDGNLKWRWRSGGDVIGVGIGASDGGVYVASLDNILRALNQGNGNQRWREELPSRPAAPPQVIDNIVVVTGVAPVVNGYATRDGQAAGTYLGPAEFQGAPLVDPVLQPFRVTMVVLTRDGRLIGLTPVASLYREPTHTPLTQLPGTRLSREPAP